jgi:hypothetical protein
MNADDAWALGRLVEFPELEECTSVRVTIDGITHRALSEDATGWRTLCRSHRLAVFGGRAYAIIGVPLHTYDFSAADVDCLCCIPAGG